MKYPNGYYAKIEYWTGKLIEATNARNTAEVGRAHRKLDYFIQQQWDSEVVVKKDTSRVKAPGLFDSHYAPKAKILLNTKAKNGEGFIALSKHSTPVGAIRLASPNSLEQYARELYQALRSADHKGLSKVAVILPDGPGLAEAIRDRLTKASGR